MKKYLVLFILLLLLVVGIWWYTKTARAEKLISYGDVFYSCEETQKNNTSSTIIKVSNGIVSIVYSGQEYKCKVLSERNLKADIVLEENGKDVKMFVSDGNNEVEVKNGQVRINANGNAVMVNEKGTSIQLKDGYAVEVGSGGNVDLKVQGVGSVKTNGGNMDIRTNDADVNVNSGKVNVKTKDTSVDIDNGKVNINTPGTGNIKIDTGNINIPNF